MPTVSSDGTVYGENGKVLHFSVARFSSDVVWGGCCFMCGRSRRDVPFNEEHVVPDWLLRMHQLHSEPVILPNRVARRYGGHKVPCCEECNTSLGKHVEVPVNELLKSGYAGLKEQQKRRTFHLLHCWAALVFLKMHIKDIEMRWSLDERKNEGMVGEAHDWSALHHIQCIARTSILGGRIEDNVQGTMFVHAGATSEFDSPFDYADHSVGTASMIRVGDTCLFNVFDDASIVLAAVKPLLAKLGPLSSPQAREVLTHLAYTNIQIVRRPRFWTNLFDERPVIDGHVPEPYKIRRYEPEVWGHMLHFANQDYLQGVDVEELKKGSWTYLLRPDGSFIEKSFTRKPAQP